jgi:hypothetical protein
MTRISLPGPILFIALIALLAVQPVSAATQFASPAFAQRWQRDEAVVPNFWGPLETAREGQLEPYAQGTAAAICPDPKQACPQFVLSGQRLVQYFDKGRMELTTPGSPVTSGLLVTEMISGRVQVGDAQFEQRMPADAPVAGDLTNPYPLYRDLAIAAYTKPQIGQPTQTVLSLNGGRLGQPIGGNDTGIPSDPAAIIATIDRQTGHGVAQGFEAFRGRVGLDVVGLAITEPFWTAVPVGGQLRLLLVQAFERRVLTYNAANPDPFKVEFGNVGQQYVRWRSGT